MNPKKSQRKIEALSPVPYLPGPYRLAAAIRWILRCWRMQVDPAPALTERDWLQRALVMMWTETLIERIWPT